MQSKPKTNSIITSTYDEATNVLTYTVLGIGDIPFDLNKVAEINQRRAAVHGWNQRLPDAAAIGLTDDEGNIIPKAERTQLKYDRMVALRDFYETGTQEWSRKGSGTGGGKSLTIEALARAKGVSYDDAVGIADRHAAAMFAGDRKKALANIRETSAKVREAMSAIRAERDAAKAAGDGDDFLDQLPN